MSAGVEYEDQDPMALRRKVVEIVREVTSAEAIFLNFFELDGQTHYSSITGTSGVAVFESFDGRPTLDGSIVDEDSLTGWSVEVPQPRAQNRFSTFTDDYEDLEAFRKSDVFLKGYGRLGVHDQARALFYEGDEFLGFLAALRKRREDFDQETVKRLQGRAEEISRLLHRARVLEREDVDSDLNLVMSESGVILYADDRALRWLTSRRAELLRANLRAETDMVVDGLVVETVFLEDRREGKVHHVTLSPVPLIRVSRWKLLSDLQRDVVALAIDGFSNQEIADKRGVTLCSVRYHLHGAFDLLGVRSKAELSSVLPKPGSDP